MNIEHPNKIFNRMNHLQPGGNLEKSATLIAPSIQLVIIYFLNRTWNLKNITLEEITIKVTLDFLITAILSNFI